jgi:hypothetical protein
MNPQFESETEQTEKAMPRFSSGCIVFCVERKGVPMTEKRIPIFTFTQRIGNTNFTVRAYCDDDIAATYEDKLLELIRSGVLQADASEKPEEPPAEHAA